MTETTDTAETVEIGGQTMTRAQFDAARAPLLAEDPGQVVLGVVADTRIPTGDPATCEHPGYDDHGRCTGCGLSGYEIDQEAEIAGLRSELDAALSRAQLALANCVRLIERLASPSVYDVEIADGRGRHTPRLLDDMIVTLAGQ